jgi:1-deoxy-D-xylulose-5-phosphate reductoisomerase
MKRFIVLGSTGSIGTSSLDVIAANPGRFEVTGLAAGGSTEKLAGQILRFRPEAVSIRDPDAAVRLRERVGGRTRIYEGAGGMLEMIRTLDADAVVNGLVGSAGMVPTFAALGSGKDVLLANKETMVMAGSIVMEEARNAGRRIVPIDSEMSAVYQCLKGEPDSAVKRIVLTASGGPFVDFTAEALARVTLSQALNHPTWTMGTKNTIDSATMMNKGLEVIEASRLFGIPGDRIEVTVHRSSLVHSFAELIDGSVLAQMSRPDMRLAIQYAMTDPDRIESCWGGLDFSKPFAMTFEPPDLERFPCLGIAYDALDRDGTAPAAMNGANERAVEAFVGGGIGFTAIPEIIRSAMDSHPFIARPTVEDLLDADRWAKQFVDSMLDSVPGAE